jgi:phage shock protein A
MSFFDRISNLISGFFSMMIGNVEENNPELVYENAIQERIKKQKDLKKSVASIVMLRDSTERELQEKQTLMDDLELALDVAMDDGDDEAALTILERKDETERQIGALQDQFQQVEVQADEAMKALNQYREEIGKLKREKEEMLAKNATAQAQMEISESLDGLSVDADIQALQRTREGINRRVSEAKISSELNNSNIDNRLKDIQARTGSAKAKRDLDRLKALRASRSEEAAAPSGGNQGGKNL